MYPQKDANPQLLHSTLLHKGHTTSCTGTERWDET